VFQFSRAIYRELHDDVRPFVGVGMEESRMRVLAACEDAMARLADDPHGAARPARTLFREIRQCFPLATQSRVWCVVERYVDAAREESIRMRTERRDGHGAALRCHAMTRHGTACRREPLDGIEYCPSHKHLFVPREERSAA
jgi:hypothetical protein